jgi:sulfite reductase (NADPH) hemoprotein beta-component
MTGKVVTANRLSDGLVVYLNKTGGWSGRVEDGQVAAGEVESAEILALAESQPTAVVGPYLIDVVEEDGVPRPVNYREVLRAKGPSVRLDLGKQAGDERARPRV